MLIWCRNFKNKKSSLYNAQMLFSSPSVKNSSGEDSAGNSSRN
jgi:hypothetical protein